MDIEILVLIMIFSFICISLSSLIFIKAILNKYVILRKIEKIDSYLAALEFHMNKAYEIIYNNRILIYSIEATGLPLDEYIKCNKEFLELVLKIIGEKIKNEFIDFYGEETFYFNISNYFQNKYDQDDIRKTSTNKMMGIDNSNDSELQEQSKKLIL